MIWNIPSTVYQVYGIGILIGIPYRINTIFNMRRAYHYKPDFLLVE